MHPGQAFSYYLDSPKLLFDDLFFVNEVSHTHTHHAFNFKVPILEGWILGYMYLTWRR